MAETSRILSCRTHYSVLNLDQLNRVPVFVDSQQVRRRYKELAILVHPDKNRATDAEAAFKRLGEAYECLVDETRQRHYLQQLQGRPLRSGSTATAQTNRTKWKKKKKPQPKKDVGDAIPRRKRTPEEIWREFQREEEELARQQFQAKGFDREYGSVSKQPDDPASSITSVEEQQDILDSNLDAKATKWASWSNPTSKRIRLTTTSGSTLKTDVNSMAETARNVAATLICCALCRRKFATDKALRRHEALSKMHLANVQSEQRKSADHL
uniref:J domain-containing protein n=1 Tax=Peronospora matthiolae TaxID=2874970 RepID=A0AAV1URC9_9STRA